MGKISDDPLAETLTGVSMAGLQGGNNVRIPPSLFVQEINIAALGAVAGDSDTDADVNADILQAACELGISTGQRVVVPYTYQIGVRSSGINPSFIYIELDDGDTLDLYVPGLLKEKDGKTLSIGRYNKMIYVKVVGAAKMLRIVGNFHKNGFASFGETPNAETAYFYEQSHTIQINIDAAASLEWLEIRGTFADKTAGHIVIAGSGASGPVKGGVIEKTVFTGWNTDYGLGQRGDIEMQGAGRVAIIDCRGSYIQTEPNGEGYSLGKPLSLTLRGGEWVYVDLDGIAGDQEFVRFDIDRVHITGGLNINNSILRMTDTDFVYSASNDWYNVKGLIKGGVCRLPTSAGAIAQSIQPRTVDGGVWDLEFLNVEITLDDSTSGDVTGYAVKGSQPNGLAAARAIRTTFANCDFDARIEHLVDAYRETGTVIFHGGAPMCWGHGFSVGGTTTPHYGFLELYDVDVRGIAGETIMFTGATSNFGLRMSGKYPWGEITFGFQNSATVSHVDGCVEVLFPSFIADTEPSSGVGLRGMEIDKRLPSAAGAPGWVCTTSHATNGGTWSAKGSLA